MPRWIVVFKDTQEMLEVRANKDLRNQHVAYARAHPELLIGGGLKHGPDDPFCGAMWIVDLETRKDVEELINADPFYVKEHRSYEIFTWGKILEDVEVTL